MIKFVGTPELYENDLYEISDIDSCKLWLDNLDEVGLDVETDGLFDHNNRMIMLQLYDPISDICFVIDVRTTDLSKLKRLEEITCLGQNLKFDYKFMKFHGIELNHIYDTFLAECCLTNGLMNRKLDLATLAMKYANIKLDKSIRMQFVGLNGQPFTTKQIVYGEGDTSCLFKIREEQLEEIRRLKIENWVNNEFKACLALADIEYNGMGFDEAKWVELSKKATYLVERLEAELDEMVRQTPSLEKYILKKVQGNLFTGIKEGYEHGRDVNIKWSSPTQMVHVFKDLGLNLPNTLERHLTKYQNQYPIVKKFIDYKKNQKLVTTYGEKFLKYVNKYTGRIHTSFWQILDTTRVSSGDKTSPNMQNLPAKVEYRNCFIPKPGFKIVTCDFSGQELRLCAEGSRDPLWLNAFIKGEDLHSNVASLIFNVPLEEVRNKPDFLRGKSYRDVSKTISFGLIYGMSKYKLSDTLSISVEEADKIIQDYFKATKKLNSYLKYSREFGIKNGYSTSFAPYRVIRYFPNWKPKLSKYEDKKIIGEIERASMNTPIQASGAQMTKLALWKIREYIKMNSLEGKVQLVMTVHDQIDCEVEESFVDEWSLIQKNIMETGGAEIIKSIPVLSEVTISDAWTK